MPQRYNPKKLVEEIEKDNVHGADWLGNAAIGVLISAGLQEKADTVDELHEKLWSLGIKLAATRPSMAPLANKIGLLFNEMDKIDNLRDYRAKVTETGTEIINSSKETNKQIVKHLKSVIGDAKTVFTYSYSATVKQAILESGLKNAVVTESRPMFEGRTLAKELGEEGLNVLMVVDGALGMYIDTADFCLIGADSVQYNGSVINKVGSKLLGMAAKENKMPFYVVCNTAKFNVLNYLGQSIELEEKTPDEVANPLRNVKIRNPYFEVVPSELITGVITEEGLMDPIDIRAKMESMRKYVEPLLDSAKN